MKWYSYDEKVLVLSLHVQPKASKDEWCGLHGERLKLRIKAPPIDGKANQHVLKFIASEFGVSQSACKLLSGDSGREKRVAVTAPQKLPELPAPLQFGFSL
jgi:uncharacterized protein (TIGR00251 family)